MQKMLKAEGEVEMDLKSPEGFDEFFKEFKDIAESMFNEYSVNIAKTVWLNALKFAKKKHEGELNEIQWVVSHARTVISERGWRDKGTGPNSLERSMDNLADSLKEIKGKFR